MATVLILGGNGFIGRAAARELQRRGFQIRILDRLSRGPSGDLPDDVELRQGDVANRQDLAEALEGVDLCVYMSGSPFRARPRDVTADSIETMTADWEPIFGTMNDARTSEPFSLIYASSAAVYSPNAALPINEQAIVGPVNAHGLEKLVLEQLASRARFPTLGLRMFNVYGPGQSVASHYCSFPRMAADKIYNRQTMTLFGDGSNKRDYIYIDDVARCIGLCAAKGFQGNTVVNVCTGVPTSLSDVIETIARLTDRELVLDRQPARSVDVPISYGDIATAHDRFGFAPQISAADGLHRMVKELGYAARSVA